MFRRSHDRPLLINLTFLLLALLVTPSAGRAQSDSGSTASPKPAKQKKADSKQNTHRAEQLARPEAGVTSTSPLALPFKRAWQYLSDSASTLAPSVDETRIYLPLAGGRVICLDRQSGSLLWTSELGGIVTAPVGIDDGSVYIATHKLADDGSEAGGSLHAVDKVTGLTIWLKD